MKHQYQKLKESLKKKIINGTYPPGSILPSEHELRAHHELARFTVRQALDELVKEGFIAKHKGKGSIVMERKRKALGLFSIKGFSAVVGEQQEGSVNTVFLRKPYKYKLRNDFFFALTDAEKKKSAVCYERLRSVNNSPVMLEYTYVPDDIPVLLPKDFIHNSLFETLHANYGLDIITAEQELMATGATKEIAAIFHIKTGTPVLHVYRRYHTNRPGFFLYSSFYCYTQQYSIGNMFQ
jgi:DNA-binding GntR family transcriptional regulator